MEKKEFADAVGVARPDHPQLAEKRASPARNRNYRASLIRHRRLLRRMAARASPCLCGERKGPRGPQASGVQAGKALPVSNIPIRVPEHFLGPRRRARRGRGVAQALRGQSCHHGGAWAARRRQDDACGRLSPSDIGAITGRPGGSGRRRTHHARRSCGARHAARLGWRADDKEEPALKP